MTERYRYESWEDYVAAEVPLKNRTREQVSEAVERMTAPDLNEFLEYQQGQLILAQVNNLWEESELPPDWKQFKYTLERAQEEVSSPSDSLARVAVAFYKLGQAIGQLENERLKESVPFMLESSIKLQAEFDRTLPLRKRNAGSEVLRNEAQRLAREIWNEDSGESIRLADACEKVYKRLLEATKDSELMNYLPGESGGLKPWLRPVAPDYAKRSGRPKKK